MLSLYFHIPFCERKCNYCNFFIVPEAGLQDRDRITGFRQDSRIEKVEEISLYEDIKQKYLNSLLSEVEFQKQKFWLWKEKVYTIYFWWGTPSEFETDKIVRILNKVNNEFDLSGLKEFSFELNPYLSSWNLTNYIKSLYQIVNQLNNETKVRFSIWIQSIDNEILKLANRNYTFLQIEKLLQDLKVLKNKYKNLSFNLDFISFGLENSNYFKKFDNFVNKYENLIDSYSVYTLELYPWSIWYKKFNGSDDKILDNFKKYLKILNKTNYLRYEISNFAKKWKESLHNKVYWELWEYLWLGISASWFVSLRPDENPDETRWGSLRSEEDQKRSEEILWGLVWDQMIVGENLESRKTPFSFDSLNPIIRYTNSFNFKNYLEWNFEFKEYKILSKKELIEEKVFLGLRTNSWIQIDEEIKQVLDLEKLKQLVNDWFLILKNNKLRLTSKWFDVYNYVLTEIINF